MAAGEVGPLQDRHTRHCGQPLLRVDYPPPHICLQVRTHQGIPEMPTYKNFIYFLGH